MFDLRRRPTRMPTSNVSVRVVRAGDVGTDGRTTEKRSVRSSW